MSTWPLVKPMAMVGSSVLRKSVTVTHLKIAHPDIFVSVAPRWLERCREENEGSYHGVRLSNFPNNLCSTSVCILFLFCDLFKNVV